MFGATKTRFGWIALLGVLGGGGLSPAFAEIADYPFQLVTRGVGTEFQLAAENNGPAPITVHATLTGKNFASDRQWPMTTVVPPFTTLSLGRVYANHPAAGGYNFLVRYGFLFGRVDAVHDADVAYHLPFEDGRGFTVSQAYGGKLTSHDNQANLYAVDFAMPIGSPVTAARAGVVIDVTLRYREGRFDKSLRDKANRVAIVHDDGTVAEYAHLSPGPAIVQVGQRVIPGELLAYSGSTGYTSGPHLHFAVSRVADSDGTLKRVSVPVLFYSSNDPAVRFSAKAGSTVWANYGATVSDRLAADPNAAGSVSGFDSDASLGGL
jgi:murein DD-endopeptidase MepM/ murein hydrolase activator NlpD